MIIGKEKRLYNQYLEEFRDLDPQKYRDIKYSYRTAQSDFPNKGQILEGDLQNIKELNELNIKDKGTILWLAYLTNRYKNQKTKSKESEIMRLKKISDAGEKYIEFRDKLDELRYGYYRTNNKFPIGRVPKIYEEYRMLGNEVAPKTFDKEKLEKIITRVNELYEEMQKKSKESLKSFQKVNVNVHVEINWNDFDFLNKPKKNFNEFKDELEFYDSENLGLLDEGKTYIFQFSIKDEIYNCFVRSFTHNNNIYYDIINVDTEKAFYLFNTKTGKNVGYTKNFKYILNFLNNYKAVKTTTII